jgi:lipoprotein-anchoring transpeptidase ErfK/SrfK
MRHPTLPIGGLITALMLSTGAAAGASAPPAPAHPSPVPDSQPLAVLTRTTEAYSQPSSGSQPVASVNERRPITQERTVLPVIAWAIDRSGGHWLEVQLPGRPNGHVGWIPPRSSTPALTHWQISVSISARRLFVYDDGRVVRSFSVVVGKPSTPTPLGRFFVEETVSLSGLAVGAPDALALSARSNVLQEFDGGPGQIAIHGTGNVGGIPGTDVSHGCIRLPPPQITWLATHIGPGTPVAIAP